MGQRVFVTGATGVLGRRVVPALVDAGHSVSAVVRSAAKAETVRAVGATAVEVDLFDRASVLTAIAGHDAAANLATHIPSGPAAAERSSWDTNDRLRRVASAIIADCVIDTGVGRLIQESITFPYVDAGDGWIDEDHPRTYFWGNDCTTVAEASAARVTAAGGSGVVLRFAMFMAPESDHCQSYIRGAQRGAFRIAGKPSGYMSFIHVDDAASAVLAALEAPAGTYNVAEPDPRPRSEHRAALAAIAGRSELSLLPELVDPVDEGVRSLARSHRISSQRLREATGWEPRIHAVDQWGDLA